MYYLLTVLLTLCVVLPVLAIIAVGLRFYARKQRKQPWLADDWLILMALVCNIALCAVTFWAVFALALGQPPPTVPLELLEPSWMTLYSTIIIVYFTYGVTKVSVILFFKRLFSVGRFVFWANVLVVLSALWALAGMIATASASIPVTNFWRGEFSVNWGALNLSMAVLDMVLDVVILLLPLTAIHKLQITRAQKISIVGIFSLGSVCCVSSVMRIYFNYEYLGLGPQTSFEWFSYVISSTNLWIITESNVSIIAACLPTLGVLFRITRGKMTQRSNGYVNNSDKIEQGARSGDVEKSTSKENTLFTDVQAGDGCAELVDAADEKQKGSDSHELKDKGSKPEITVTTEFGHFTN